MKLKKLELYGFKSFCDKSAIHFPGGISAIVGPNGCGKSNVMDALRWVMGEQSVKQLRGKSMADVIFSGANGKPPVNLAEVNLTLANDNGGAPEELKDYSEIMLTRRLYRSGESAYFLNKQPCRLKDIQSIFLGSGAGTKSYSFIQQGNIGAITEAGPDERRYFVEDAAGTTRYKVRKVEALRKIESTRRNLLRLDDILSVITSQMAGLKRQARKADRYKKLKAKSRRLDVRLGLLKFDDYQYQIETTRAALDAHKNDEITHASRLQKIDAALEQIKQKRLHKNQQISDLKSQRYDLQRNIDTAENDRTHLKSEIQRLAEEATALEKAREDVRARTAQIEQEHAQSQKTLAGMIAQTEQVRAAVATENETARGVRSELDALRNQQKQGKSDLLALVAQEAHYKSTFQSANTHQEGLHRRLERKDQEERQARQKLQGHQKELAVAREQMGGLTTRLADIDQQLETVRQSLTEANANLGAQVKTVNGLEQQRVQVSSRYSALKKMEDNFEWYRDGVRSVLNAHQKQGKDDQAPAAFEANILGLTADVLTPAPSYEAAVEAALGERLQYILVDTTQSGLNAIAYLKNKGKGRSGFIPVKALKLPDDVAPKVPVERSLLQHVDVLQGYEQVAQLLLGQVAFAEDLPEALQVYNRNGIHQWVVTRAGDLLSPHGTLMGGAGDQLGDILTKKKELRALQGDLKKLAAEIERQRKLQTELEGKVREFENSLHGLTVDRNQTTQEQLAAEKALFKAEESCRQTEKSLELIELEKEQLHGEKEDAGKDISRYQAALARIEEQIKLNQGQVAEVEVRMEQVEDRVATADQRLMDLQLELTALQAKADNARKEQRRLQEYQRDNEHRLAQLDTDIKQKINRQAAARQQLEQIGLQLSERYEALKRMEAAIDVDERAYHALDQSYQHNEQRVSELRDRREETSQKTRAVELTLSQLMLQQKNITERLLEHYRKTIPGLREELAAIQDDRGAALDADALAQKLEMCQRSLDRIGNVNLAAIEEYDALAERHQFLAQQREDLVAAIEGLQQVIRKINRITQKRFNEALTAINTRLEEVFPRLFEGGRAWIELSDPEQPLDSGVEYFVQPPGKKLTRMSLLSGGEKALAAIAFIFSIFLMRPASFCLLDEIDAPLDEANVVRFNNLMETIGQKSQVVMVTHNKRTMEFADTLFGITMENKGISKLVSVDLRQAAEA